MKSVANLFFCLIFSFPVMWDQNTMTGLDVMIKYQEVTRIDYLSSTITYENQSKKGRIQKRELEQFIMRNEEGTNTYHFLLRFIAPGDVRGTGTLTIQHEDKQDDQWLYLPALRATKRISPNKKTGRFMGTEMTYEDLSNYLSEPLEKFEYQLIGEEILDGTLCYLITSLPIDKDEIKNSGYSKRKLWIAKDNWMNVKTIFYDKKGKECKEYRAYDITSLGKKGHLRPQRIVMNNLKTGNKTIVTYSNMKVDEEIDQAVFSKSYLETI
ncbi:MAG: outer membrane lipoprotein-sorting protein [Saprospiraceae bacterium]|nr:outer membrane lipoprotein-sorting protein [Saprospiraceae bacterium]